jgi:methyltransferase (TIGR00027 family)
MPEQSVQNTALGAATCRLIEQSQPSKTRLFEDLVVKDLVGTSIRSLMRFGWKRNYVIRQTDAIMPGLYGVQICRTRFIDDVVQAALSKGIGQLVILGAGYDTRAYRLAGMERVKVLEVDLESVQEDKKKKLRRRFGRLPENITFVPIDFGGQRLETVLAGTTFDSSASAVFVWEGVTQYLSEESVLRTMGFVGGSAPGSILVFTYVLKSVIERRSDVQGADRLMEALAKRNSPWLFGLEQPGVSSFLVPYHLDRIADVGNADYQTRYLNPLGRSLVVSDCERVVQARVVRP